MCFYHEPDWTAGLYADDAGPADQPATRCEECRCRIHKGEPRRHVFMQEHAYCPECGVEYDPDGTTAEPCTDPDGHRKGEVFECDICERCGLMLSAIQQAEADEGCVGSETQPAFGELHAAMWEGEGERYVERALADYPELAASGALDDFYRNTREYDRVYELQEQWDDEDLEPVEELGGEA